MKNSQTINNKLQNLKAYQLAIELVTEVKQITKSWNNDFAYQLSDNWLVDLCLIVSQMEEAYEQQSFEGHQAFLWESIGALARSTVNLEMSYDLEILDKKTYIRLKQSFDELEILLKGLANSLKKIFGK